MFWKYAENVQEKPGSGEYTTSWYEEKPTVQGVSIKNIKAILCNVDESRKRIFPVIFSIMMTENKNVTREITANIKKSEYVMLRLD